jgi:DDE superfamily endonuclease
LIEDAYALAAPLGLEVWCEDEAGPFQTVPQPGPSWQPQGEPAQQPHEYFRQGTAKVLTLFHPRTGAVRVQGVTSCINQVLHGWLQEELSTIVAALPEAPPTAKASRQEWERWLQGLKTPLTLPAELPPLRLLLVLDNLAGHKTPVFVAWLLAHGILPLYTPLGGSWLNMAESIQRILRRRALDGQHPQSPEEIMAWLEAVAAHWNKDPTPFVWGGKRRRRRERQRERRHRQGGSGAYSRKPVRRRKPPSYGYKRGK